MEAKGSAVQTVSAYCGKCRIVRAHTIAATDGEAVSKVRCNICGSSHKFRNAPEPGGARKSRVTKDPAVEAATAKLLWEDCLAGAKGRECPYSMTAKYRVGDIVDHAAFGKGVVQKLYANKCDMLFKDGKRLMVSTNQ